MAVSIVCKCLKISNEITKICARNQWQMFLSVKCIFWYVPVQARHHSVQVFRPRDHSHHRDLDHSPPKKYFLLPFSKSEKKKKIKRSFYISENMLNLCFNLLILIDQLIEICSFFNIMWNPSPVIPIAMCLQLTVYCKAIDFTPQYISLFTIMLC